MNPDELKMLIGSLLLNCSLEILLQSDQLRKSFWKKARYRVRVPYTWTGLGIRMDFVESCTLEVVHKMGGNFLLKLNIGSRPIANKYREGKMKSTLERGLKVPEIAEREANETSFFLRDCCGLR
jgi:hypothetical protein